MGLEVVRPLTGYDVVHNDAAGYASVILHILDDILRLAISQTRVPIFPFYRRDDFVRDAYILFYIFMFVSVSAICISEDKKKKLTISRFHPTIRRNFSQKQDFVCAFKLFSQIFIFNIFSVHNILA